MKSLYSLLIISVLCILFMSHAKAGFGPCTAPPLVHDDFNATKFRGLWYIYSVSNDYYESFPNEWRTELVMSKSNETIDYDFKIFSSTFDYTTNKTQRYEKVMNFNSATDPASSYKTKGGIIPQTLTVMKTDHYSYAIVDVCKSVGLYHTRHYEVWARDKLPAKYHRHLVAETMKDLGFHHKTDFRRAPNIECYKPDPQRKD